MWVCKTGRTSMDLPVQPEEPLPQPRRARLFSLLSELRRPAGTWELAERLALHPNAVRAHLERLREAGLVERGRTRQTVGRSRDMWSVAPDARPGGDPASAYADLGRWLARAISPRRTGFARWRRPDGSSAEEKMHAALVSLGFQPERQIESPTRLTYRLRDCPYRDALRESQPAVCALHRGMTRGLLEVIAPETKLAGFVPRDPYRAGCLIELRGGLADEAGSR